MKLFTFIGAGAFIFFSSVIIKNNNLPQAELFDTRWNLSVIHTDSGKLSVHSNAFLRLPKMKNSAGGNGGCNSFGSSVVTEGNTIRFSDVFSTKMYCDGVQVSENLFFGNLVKVNRFIILADTLLLYNGDILLLTFIKHPDQASR